VRAPRTGRQAGAGTPAQDTGPAGSPPRAVAVAAAKTAEGDPCAEGPPTSLAAALAAALGPAFTGAVLTGAVLGDAARAGPTGR
jgi:hypothetical protein